MICVLIFVLTLTSIVSIISCMTTREIETLLDLTYAAAVEVEPSFRLPDMTPEAQFIPASLPELLYVLTGNRHRNEAQAPRSYPRFGARR